MLDEYVCMYVYTFMKKTQMKWITYASYIITNDRTMAKQYSLFQCVSFSTVFILRKNCTVWKYFLFFHQITITGQSKQKLESLHKKPFNKTGPIINFILIKQGPFTKFIFIKQAPSQISSRRRHRTMEYLRQNLG